MTSVSPVPEVAQPAVVRALIDERASIQGGDIYFVAPHTGHTLTFDALARTCRRIAAGLIARGLQPGDHVSLVMGNGVATVEFLLGALYGGFCVNPINLLAQSDQMRYVIEHADARLIVAAPEWIERVRALCSSVARPIDVLQVHPDEPDVAAALGDLGDVSPALPPLAREDLALLMYTSGTTGRPKGVMLTQGNLVANAHAIAREHRLTPADRVTAVLPLFHINAFTVTMLAPLAAGGSLVMPPRFSASGFWDMVVQHRCTWLNVVPTMISYLLEGDAPARDSLAAVRFCRSASAALPPEHHRAFEERFGIGIIETMGLTETAAPVFSNPIEALHRKIGSVGRPSGCEARVVDAEGRDLPDGQVGEIVVRGPQVMAGYYKDPEATTAAFYPGRWLRTGDLGYRDPDGFYFVTGRIKELIIKGGENIAPREVDEALLKHPAVLDAAAFGVPDRHYGQEVAACVVLREGATLSEEELRMFCERELGRYKAPKAIRFVTELPRGPSGKVQRLRLVSLVGNV